MSHVEFVERIPFAMFARFFPPLGWGAVICLDCIISPAIQEFQVCTASYCPQLVF